MSSINPWAVLVAAFSAFVVGGLWYSPLLFLDPWLKESKANPKAAEQGHGTWVFVGSFLLSLLAAAAFAWTASPLWSLQDYVRQGLIIGFCWVGASLGMNYSFASKSFRLLLIDGGYHLVQFLLYGLILGVWR